MHAICSPNLSIFLYFDRHNSSSTKEFIHKKQTKINTYMTLYYILFNLSARSFVFRIDSQTYLLLLS